MLSSLLFDIMEYSQYFVDAGIVIILLIFAFAGMKKGFINSLFGFIGTIVALVVGFVFCTQIASWLESSFGFTTMLSGVFKGWLEGTFPDMFAIDISSVGLATALESVTFIPSFIVTLLVQVYEGVSLPAGTTLGAAVAPVMANFSMQIISFIALFIACKIVISILKKFFNNLFESIKILGSINGLLGFVLGAVKGLIFVYILLLISNMLPLGDYQQYLDASFIVKFLNDLNPMGYIISWISNVDWLKDFVNSILGEGFIA